MDWRGWRWVVRAPKKVPRCPPPAYAPSHASGRRPPTYQHQLAAHLYSFFRRRSTREHSVTKDSIQREIRPVVYCAAIATTAAKMAPKPESYIYNLGSFHREVSTDSPAAQVWFDRGLIWSYGFHHEESARCKTGLRCLWIAYELHTEHGQVSNTPWRKIPISRWLIGG